MVVIRQSQTCPINPPDVSPVLSIDEVWEVMLLKCRKPELFVAPISGSKVLEETPTFMKRSVTVKEGMGPPGGDMIEELQIRKPWKVDFNNLSNGTFISNIVSRGKVDTDLYLTFYFEWQYPKLEEGSEEVKETEQKLLGMANGAVQHTIDLARDLAREGKLGKGLEL